MSTLGLHTHMHISMHMNVLTYPPSVHPYTFIYSTNIHMKRGGREQHPYSSILNNNHENNGVIWESAA